MAPVCQRLPKNGRLLPVEAATPAGQPGFTYLQILTMTFRCRPATLQDERTHPERQQPQDPADADTTQETRVHA